MDRDRAVKQPIILIILFSQLQILIILSVIDRSEEFKCKASTQKLQ